MHRTRRTTTTIAAIIGALLLGGCSLSSKGAAPPETAISVPTADEPTTDAPPAPAPSGETASPSSGLSEEDAEMGAHLRETGDWAASPELCLTIAAGPWDEVAYENDPVGLVSDGALPPGLDPGLDEAPNEINEWTDVGEYHDPSTLDSPGAIRDAMRDAGFEAGAEAYWTDGSDEATITAVRFRDAEAAQAVLTALAEDYCTRAESSRALPDGTGMDIVRDSGATRVLAVLDDTVISLWACSCISSRGDDVISDWHDELRARIDRPAPDASGA